MVSNHCFLTGLIIYFYCIVKYDRRFNNAIMKSSTLSKNGFKNHGFVGDIERHPSFSFNSQSQMTYKSDDFTETENENVDQSKINAFELEQEIPISPKSTKKSKAPIPMSFKTENQSQTEPSSASLVRKSQTPSPNSNKTLDEIVLISEVIDTLTEMKEPNGKTYFVDENRMAASVGDTHEDSEQKTAIEYLDDVLKKEEVNDNSIRVAVDESGISTSVVAVVHLNGVAEEEPSLGVIEKDLGDEKQTSTEDSTVEEITTFVGSNAELEEEEPILNNPNIAPDISQQESEVAVPDSSTSQIIESNKTNSQGQAESPQIVCQENDGHQSGDVKEKSLTDDQPGDQAVEQVDVSNVDSEKPMSFKERLAMLLGQQPVAEVRRISPRANDQPAQNTQDVKLKQSKSEPDIFNSMQGVFNDIRSKYEVNEPDSSQKLLKMTATDDIHIDNSNTSVPVPPKFDPFIYRTIGSRHNGRMTLKIDDENEPENSPKPPLTAPIIMDNDQRDVILRKKSSEDDDQTRMVSIKDRLENILKRGPPDRFSRPKSIAPAVTTVDDDSVTVNSSSTDNDKIDVGDDEVIRIKESKRPFDTVHKQKVLFNDVLKSIGVETRPSVIRANSITKIRQKPATIADARNALKHVSVDWKKNVN